MAEGLCFALASTKSQLNGRQRRRRVFVSRGTITALVLKIVAICFNGPHHNRSTINSWYSFQGESSQKVLYSSLLFVSNCLFRPEKLQIVAVRFKCLTTVGALLIVDIRFKMPHYTISISDCQHPFQGASLRQRYYGSVQSASRCLIITGVLRIVATRFKVTYYSGSITNATIRFNVPHHNRSITHRCYSFWGDLIPTSALRIVSICCKVPNHNRRITIVAIRFKVTHRNRIITDRCYLFHGPSSLQVFCLSLFIVSRASSQQEYDT